MATHVPTDTKLGSSHDATPVAIDAKLSPYCDTPEPTGARLGSYYAATTQAA